MAPPTPAQAEKMLGDFFTSLAVGGYAKQTGNTTSDILAQILDDVSLGINSYSTIHDNACGPGTATEILLKFNSSRAMLPATIMATDSNPAMIDALNKTKSENSHEWRQVTPKLMDSHSLDFPNEYFTLSICNFGIFNFTTPLKALLEVHRTLKHGGTAIITCWKRYGVIEIVKAAQKSIKPDSQPMPQAGPQFENEGYLPKLLERAEWERGKIKVFERNVLVKEGEDNFKNLVEFMSGKLTAPARIGWTDEENAKWPDAIKVAVEEEKKKNGGILMEGWIVLARKWDKMSA